MFVWLEVFHVRQLLNLPSTGHLLAVNFVSGCWEIVKSLYMHLIAEAMKLVQNVDLGLSLASVIWHGIDLKSGGDCGPLCAQQPFPQAVSFFFFAYKAYIQENKQNHFPPMLLV